MIKIFKHAWLVAALALVGFAFQSCDDKNDFLKPTPPAKELATVVSTSVDDGHQLNPAAETDILVMFSDLVAINKDIHPTINGAEIIPGFATKADGKPDHTTVSLPVELEPNTSYTIQVPEGAFIRAANQAKCQAFEISFATGNSSYVPDEPDVTINLDPITNPNATPAAKAIYKYLADNYGKTMLSGAMGEVGWGLGYSDFIAQQAGAYPAVVGFDFLHLCYSGEGSWINYGDITPVKTAWDNGSIPAFSWHWNVPKTQGSNDYSFSAGTDTDFMPENILKDGTWEQSVAEADLERIAGHLLQLQDAGIAVLWRPFHEAAGDYKWGAWFWWGRSGVEVTKELYIWMRNKLEKEYGVNNLIWVWTVQMNDEGSIASINKMAEAYPGDAYVDILGPDVYPQGELTDHTDQYELLNVMVKGHKMLAMTECGNLPDPKQAYDNKGLWSYFMQWYDMEDGKYGFFNYAGPAQWQTVVNSPYVVNQDGLPSFK